MASFEHPFDQSIALSPGAGRNLLGQPPALYWNVVGPYGGITAAIFLNAVLQQAGVIGDPLALTVNFSAPVRDAGFELQIQRVHSSRTTQHWSISMVQSSGANESIIVAQASVVMGVRRALWSLQTAVKPQAAPPEQARRRDSRSGLAWFDRYDLRFLVSPMKASDPVADVLSWVRDEPPRSLDFPALAAICDSLYPAIFVHRQAYVAIATVSMTTYFHTTRAELQDHGQNYLLTAARSTIYQQGFCDAQGEVWAGERMVATTQQVMWYKN